MMVNYTHNNESNSNANNSTTTNENTTVETTMTPTADSELLSNNQIVALPSSSSCVRYNGGSAVSASSSAAAASAGFEQMNKNQKIAYLARDLLNDLERFNESNNSSLSSPSSSRCSNGGVSGGLDSTIPNYVGMLGRSAVGSGSGGSIMYESSSGQVVKSTSGETKKRRGKRKAPDGAVKAKRKAKSQYQRKNIK